MEQVNNNAALAMLQAVAAQTQTAQTDKSDGSGDFQKLMEKAQQSQPESGQPNGKVEDTPKAEVPQEGKSEKTPVQKEDSLTRIKKMLEQNGNAVAFKPDSYLILIDKNTGEMTASYNPGEWVAVFTGEGVENIPITDLEPWQQAQLDQLLLDPHPIDVSDPRVDAMLKATAPDAENSPAALLEQVTSEQFGKVYQQTADKAADGKLFEAERPEKAVFVEVGDDAEDAEVEVTGAEQAPQRLFHDVKAAPVKVGEVYDTEQTEAPDVAQQIDTGLAQALDKGDSMVRIQLNPENLGSVTVEISRSAEGIIHVALNARSGETRGLLERHAGELQGMLASRTQQGVEVEVQRQQESQQGQNQQHQQQNYDGRNGHAQDGQQRRHQRHEQTSSQDFIQQLRLGLIPLDGDGA